MAKKAIVTGRTQNRTALGIIAAYLEMYPSTTLSQLKQIFSKSSVCPDAGISELFYTTKELEVEKKGGNEWFQKDQACFTQDGEWLNVKGTKVAFCKMWTAPSLNKLQQKAAQYGITAQVGDIDKNDKHYKVGYSITYEGGKKGIPFWVWIVLLLVLAAVGYFLLTNKEEEKPATTAIQPQTEQVQKVVEEKVNVIKDNFNAAQFEKKSMTYPMPQKQFLMS